MRTSQIVENWFATFAEGWVARAALNQVRMERIVSGTATQMWADFALLENVLNGLVEDAIQRSLPGDRVQIELRLHHLRDDWATLIVRDWGGGTFDDKRIDASIETLVHRLEGYLDVANYPGRSTYSSIHLPIGTLAGWLRNQKLTTPLYAIHWEEIAPSDPATSATCDKAADMILQHLLQGTGSYIKLDRRSFLYATPTSLDAIARGEELETVINRVLKHLDPSPSVAVEWHCLGAMTNFIDRLQAGSMVEKGRPTSPASVVPIEVPAPKMHLPRPGKMQPRRVVGRMRTS